MAERQDEQDTTKESTRAAASGRQALQEASQQTQIEHAVKEGIHAGAEILSEGSRAAAEVVQRGLSEAREDQQHIVAQAAEQGQQLIHEVAEAAVTYAKTAETTVTELQSLITATRAASAGFVDAQRIWADWYSRAVQFGTRLPHDMVRCRNIHDVAAAQSAWMHDSLNGLIEASTEILRMTREMADRSLRPLEEWRQQARQGWSNGAVGGNAQENSGRQQAGHAGSGGRAAKAHADPARAGDKPARTG
jgi:hypothetical protein